MVSMLREDQIKHLSPEGRVKNSYEAMYYNAKSGDPEMDAIVKAEIQRAFQQHDVVLGDKPDTKMLRAVMLDAYKSSAKELQGSELSVSQVQSFVQDFDSFTNNHQKFYEKSFESYENKYQGEPVDFSADYNRMIQEHGGIDPNRLELSEADLDAMEQEYNQRVRTAEDELNELKPKSKASRVMESGAKHVENALTPDTKTNKALRTGLTAVAAATPQGRLGKAAVAGAVVAGAALDQSKSRKKAPSGLSYGAHVPEAKAQTTRRSYQQKKQEEAAAQEMKGQDYDKAYDQYARNRSDSYQKTTAGDSYGIDEHEQYIPVADVPEDDGPDL